MRTEIEPAEDTYWRARAVSLAQQRPAMAVLAAASVLALLLTVLRAGPLSILPAYPAVILAFLIAVVLPGFIIARALLRDADVLVLVAVAPALALGLMAAPGIVALEAHLSLDDFALMYALLAAAACGATVLVAPSASTPEPDQPNHDSARGNILLAGLLVIALGGVLTTPFWAADRLAGDFDDWTSASYVRDYLDTDRLNAEEPFFGTGEPVNPRMRTNVWVLSQALVADAAGVGALELLQNSLRPLITLFAVLAAYALSRTLFRSTTVGLLAAAFLLGHALLDLSPYEGMGRNLFLRISEDKMAGGFILFPVALIFAVAFVSRRSVPTYAGFAITVLALSVVHPMPLLFMAAALTMLAAIRILGERSPRSLSSVGLLLAAVAAASIWPLIQRELLVDVAPALFETGAGADQFRAEFRTISLGGGWLIGSHHLIMHPLVLATIALTPLVWLMARRSIGGQLVAALTASALLLLFVPLLATPVAEVMAPETLWRVPWMVPVGPVLAYVSFAGARRVSHAFDGPTARRYGLLLAPVVIVAAVLAIALIVQEEYLRLDGGAFYDRTATNNILPDMDGSIFLGGLDRARSGNWRIKERDEKLFDYLDANVPRGSTVLVGPPRLNLLMPTYLTDIYPTKSIVRTIYPQGSDLTRQVAEQEQAFGAFYRGAVSRDELATLLETYGVDYVVVELRTEAAAILRSLTQIAPEEFSPRVGAPDVALRRTDAGEYTAWALDANTAERIAGARLTVPAEIAGATPVLGFDIVVAPAVPVKRDASARVVLSFGEVGAPATGNVVTNIDFRAGTGAGELVEVRREPPVEVVPGGSYFLTFGRQGDSPEDTYDGDLWVVAVRVKYWPPGLHRVEGTNFLVYEAPSDVP